MEQKKFDDQEKKLTIADLSEALLQLNLINDVDHQKLKGLNEKSKEHPLNLIGKLNLPDRRRPGKSMAHDDIMSLLAKHWGLEYVRVDPLNIQLEVVATVLPLPYIKRLNIVPIEVTKEKVIILTSEPYSLSWIDEVRAQVKREIEVKLNAPMQISHLLNEIFVVQKAFKGIAKEQGLAGAERLKLLRQGKIEELDRLLERNKGKKLSNPDGFVTNIVDWLLNYAAVERASDIHLEPKRGLGLVRFRVDGDLRTVYRLDPDAMQMVITRFKILGEMKIDDKRKPQDGSIKREIESGRIVEMRLSTLPTNYGEKLVIRIFDKSVAAVDLDFIGFGPEDKKVWNELINQPQGLILVTGPTGSGKTTTLYTTLSLVATPDVNICTAEDPVEMEVDALNQVQVNPQIGLTFAECIRSFLRQDPDIIMVGEIRDLETGEMAIQSSLTGHLVFSTLHTNGALATIQRLIDIGLPTYLLNSSISGILAQRLVKKLCPSCKELTPADRDKWESLIDGEKIESPNEYYRAVGCEDCKDTGYRGRLCIYELVKFDDCIKKVIHAKIEISELREKTRGMFTSIRANGARKVIEGETTIEEILRVVY